MGLLNACILKASSGFAVIVNAYLMCVPCSSSCISPQVFPGPHPFVCVAANVGKFFEFRLPFGCIINYNEEILSLTRKGKHDSNPGAVSVT